MGLFDPTSGGSGGGSVQQASVPTAPRPAIDPIGAKPKAKKQTQSFLGADTSPDATQQSTKTLLGQ